MLYQCVFKMHENAASVKGPLVYTIKQKTENLCGIQTDGQDIADTLSGLFF